ncbi:MAG: [FeFe] hydrogenase H-cluster radical SAM maturase HydG [Candidatus Latescibacteria bacterium]|nr:[FeFe] hydrogenase H-cluster radical SAM maturase HydG [Candidatus Latescibacterota bacterium]
MSAPRPADGRPPQRALSAGFADFVDEAGFQRLIGAGAPDAARVRDVLARSLAKEPLAPDEAAVLLRAEAPDLIEEIFDAARRLKRDVYGRRIVLFAPLYIGNLCVNDCGYCAFRASNPDSVRRTLSPVEVEAQVAALERSGHKRLILVFGEHPRYTPEFIADTVRRVAAVRTGHGEIRRVNINAAPLDVAGFRTVHEAGIGTYQVFQETYHRATYARYHPARTFKGDYDFRLDSPNRAFEAGCDDFGIGALFGLADWRFDVLGLVAHARHLRERYGVGPHTLSFPRLQPASGVDLAGAPFVSDDDFKRLVAVLRLSVPYAGMILTAREPAALRREILGFGVSQIDAGSRIELGGYTEAGDAQVMDREQFALSDLRPLDEVLRQLLEDGHVPSFCTACYRMGRTGEHFMEYAIPGFIERFCTPNALVTLTEYLQDYASEPTREAGRLLVERELAAFPEGEAKESLRRRLQATRDGQHDLYE